MALFELRGATRPTYRTVRPRRAWRTRCPTQRDPPSPLSARLTRPSTLRSPARIAMDVKVILTAPCILHN